MEAAIELPADGEAPYKPAALLRGTARGLEVVVDASAEPDAICAAIVQWLDKAPGFFKGSDVRVRVESGPLPSGALGRIDAIAQRFELRIVDLHSASLRDAAHPGRAGACEVAAAAKASASTTFPLGIVEAPALAAGSAPTEFDDEPTSSGTGVASPTLAGPLSVEQLPDPHTVAEDAPTQSAAPLHLAATAEIELITESSATRLVVGPVRSGVILDHKGHLIVFGDVNPGAEVRAEGNIVVLGRLRGTAHAGIGQELGFILALRLEPQQLRIGRRVARSGEDTHASEPEIAFATDDKIIVERYQGKLPRNLASSI